MKNKLIEGALLLAVVGLLMTGCAKTYRYDFKDGYGNEAADQDTAGPSADTSMFHVDRSKYATARLFPGLVGDQEPQLKDYKVDLNLDYIAPDKSLMRISVVPDAWLSTGLYAPAGELITIVVPDGIYGLTAQVGVWTDNLTGQSVTLRDPVIVNRVQLFPGVNYIRNLYGGPLIIQAAHPLGGHVQLTVTGAVKSPDFILGQTTDAEWKELISKTTVPWFELRGKRIIFDLQVSKLENYPLNDPTELMKAWDSVVAEDYNAWYGMSDHPSDLRDQAPELPWREVQDIQPSVGYGHNGYPIVAKNDDHWFAQITSVDALRNSSNWGSLHELGHNYQMGSTWEFDGLGEVSNNLHSFKVANRYGHKHPKMSSGDFTNALAFAATDDDDKKFSSLNVTEMLTPFVQVFEKYGYGFQTYLCTAARHDPHTAINNQDKIDFYYERLSEYVKMDMAEFMAHWGLQVSQQSESKISAEYPPLNKKVWEFNPWTGQGGEEPVPVDRSKWEVLNDPPHTGSYDVSKLFDGDHGSFWASNDPGYPYAIEVDMQKMLTVNGFTFIQRKNYSGNRPTKVDIYVGNDPNNLVKVVSEGDLPYVPYDQSTPEKLTEKVDLPAGTAPFRYFKVVFLHGNNLSTKSIDLEEIEIY